MDGRFFDCGWFRWRSLFLLFCGMAAMSAIAAGRDASESKIVDLRCEYLKTPLGLDDRQPALSWTIEDERRRVVQTAYRVWVASSEALLAQGKGDLWDTGEVKSDQSHLVVYGGKPLVSRQRYFWKVAVKVTDADGSERAAVSPSSWWEMGLLQPSDWQGSWIEAASTQPVDDPSTRLWVKMCLVPPELGKYKPHPEAAKTLRAVTQQKLDAVLPAPIFRTAFDLPSEIKQARIYISGLGFHEATINGKPMSDHIHDPSVTQYVVRGAYVTHDITSHVQSGRNELLVSVGSGYFHEPVVWGNPGVVDGNPSLRAQIEVELTDGQRLTFATDRSWKSTTGPILKSNYWAGEVYDARKAVSGKDTRWEAAREVGHPVPALNAQRCEPERIIRKIKPVAVTEPSPGIWVLDMGEVFVGTFALKVKAPAGTSIIFRTAEWLWNPKIQGPHFSASRIYYENAELSTLTPGMIAARMRGGTFLSPVTLTIDGIERADHPHIGTPTLVYVARGDANGEYWQPKFTLQPMRYIEVQGLKEKPSLDLLTGLVITSDEEVVGSFSCENPRFNDIFEACMNSTRYTTHGMSWDNAVERLQSQVYNAWSAPFASYVLWYPNLWRKVLEDQRLINRPEPGPNQAFANVVYGQRGGPGWSPTAPRWVIPESVTVELPVQLYERYGEIRSLAAHYPQMKQWLEACIDPATGRFRPKTGHAGWNDHFCMETAADSDYHPSFDDNVFMGMMMYQWIRDTASTARLLGKMDDAAELDLMAQKVRDEVNRAGYDATRKTYGAAKSKKDGSIDAQYGWHGMMALAISTGVAPKEDIPAILENCIADMKAHYNHHHAAGHITHQLLYDVYSDHGMIETCYDMMNATGFPSFTYQLQSGNRTIPEGPAWKDRFPAFASAYQNECQEPARWFTQTLCGVSPDRSAPAFKHFFLKPRFPARLPSAQLLSTTPYGAIESHWKQDQGRVTWTVRIPPNSSATAYLPAKRADILEGEKPLEQSVGCRIQKESGNEVECVVGSGQYVFTFPAPVNAPSRLSELK